MSAGGQGAPQGPGVPEQPGFPPQPHGQPGQPEGGPAPSGGPGPFGPTQPFDGAPQFDPAPGQPPQQPSYDPGAAPAAGAGHAGGGAASGGGAAGAGIAGMSTGLLATLAGCLVAVLLAVAGLVFYLNQREPNSSGEVVAGADGDAGEQGDDSADGSGGADAGAGDSAAHAGPAPDFQEGTYFVPSICGTFALRYDDYGDGTGLSPVEATFSGGEAKGEGSGGPAVTVEEVVEPGDGGPSAVVRFSCYAGGSYSYASLGVYDADRNLVAEIEPWSVDLYGTPEDPLSGSVYSTSIEDLSVSGPAITFSVPQIGVYGDGPDCNGCARSGVAELAYEWSGSGVDHTDTAFLIGGERYRVPAVSDVQTFVDAIGAGNDKAVELQAYDDFFESLDYPLGDGMDPSITRRTTDLAPGAEVGSCELVSAAGGEGGEYYMRDGRSIMTGVNSYSDMMKPGDSVCGFNAPDFPASDAYSNYLLLRGHEDGSFKVYELGVTAG